jgi:hypothetical protein
MTTSRETVVILGMMTKIPVAGVAWLNAQYLTGFDRLGYDVYYIEQHARTPTMLMRTEEDNGAELAAAYVAGVMNRFGFGDRWSYQALHGDGRYYGLSERRVRSIFDRAGLVINLHGGTMPLPAHRATDRLVYLDTDPVDIQIKAERGDARTLEMLDHHVAFFTWAGNFGNPDCLVPQVPGIAFRPTFPPIVSDQWGGFAPTRDLLTTIGNWEQPWRTLTYRGEVYYWSKHLEFLKFLDLPHRTHQRFELALGLCPDTARESLEGHGWAVRDAEPLSSDLDAYREYITSSRGEFTVAKDQNVRLRSGWFSERSASYLAAGRPVITQETGFSNVLPSGEGLFGFLTMDEILAAVEAINSDYERNSRTAREIARDYFSYDVVLPPILDAVGLPARPRATSLPIHRGE